MDKKTPKNNFCLSRVQQAFIFIILIKTKQKIKTIKALLNFIFITPKK